MDDKRGNVNRLNSVHGYAVVNVNYDSEFTADLHQTEGQMDQGSCFHRCRIIWPLRPQAEEWRLRSLHPRHVADGVRNTKSFTYFSLQIYLVALHAVVSSGSWICYLDPYKLLFPWIY